MRVSLVMRHKADVRSVAAVIVAAALILVPQFVELPVWFAPLWIAVAIVACSAGHVVVHNHCHCPIFVSDARNRIFNLVATFARGHCASDVYLPHNVNHHAEQGRAGDWIRTGLGGHGHPAVRLARFVVRATVSMARARRRLGRAGQRMIAEPFRTSLAAEKILLPAVILALFVHDWQRALLFAVVPWTASLVWLVGVNYVQHEGCDAGSAFAHSRNFTGRFTNWLLFNNGYHTAHHLDPHLHWSAIPALHAAIAKHIPAQLNERSATRYMVRRILGNVDTPVPSDSVPH